MPTLRRIERLRSVLDRRQPDLTVLLDNVHKPHNFSAILRSADAVGVFEAHAVWPDPRLRLGGKTSGGSGKWVKVHTHRDIREAAAVLHRRGFSIVAAHPSAAAEDFRSVDYTGPTALLLGAELEGLSSTACASADTFITIPMFGFVQSLNVSVAAATVLFEAQHQRLRAGLYDRPRLDPGTRASTLFEWTHPRIAARCRSQGIEYPPMAADGRVLNPRPGHQGQE